MTEETINPNVKIYGYTVGDLLKLIIPENESKAIKAVKRLGELNTVNQGEKINQASMKLMENMTIIDDLIGVLTNLRLTYNDVLDGIDEQRIHHL